MSTIETGDKITRKYSNFRGVDFRGDECGLNRSPDSLNVWRNYKKLASIETRPGLERILTYSGSIRSMMWHDDKLYFLDDKGELHHYVPKNGNAAGHLSQDAKDIGANAVMFVFDGTLYAKGVKEYWNVTKGEAVEPFIPTTTSQRDPNGSGKEFQDVNMLSPYRINSFCGKEGETLYVFDATDLDPTPESLAQNYWKSEDAVLKVTVIKADGTEEDWWDKISTYNAKAGWVRLSTAPPDGDGRDNVLIRIKKSKGLDSNITKIRKCTMAQEFDNRIFLSGNPDYPSTIWHSSKDNPGYFSDLDVYVDGVDKVPIRSMVAGNNGLWVFKEDSDSKNSVYYHQPALDEEYGKVYPSSHSSIALGCVGRAVNFNDDTAFFSQRGMESASTDVTTEQFVTHRSSLVDRTMLTNEKYKDMVLAEWEGYLFVFIGNDVYLADSRAVMTNENHVEYEWYRWKLADGFNVTCATVHDGVLYVCADEQGKESHIFSFTGKPEDGDQYYTGFYSDGDKWIDYMPINSYWTTPKDRFGAQNKLKTTNKKGCVVEATGDIDVYVKVEDTDFEHIGTYENVEDYFVSRIKRKKFKDIQLKFQSATGFSLDSATLECFIGGYIKR